MPELPEVETVCKALEQSLLHQTLNKVTVRNGSLRHAVTENDFKSFLGLKINSMFRRAKYIIASLGQDKHLLIHLGMTGKHRVVEQNLEFKKHEHLIFELDNNKQWRYEDVRRFGFIVPYEGSLKDCPLLSKLGPEPLTEQFTAEYLYAQSRNKSKAIKTLIMDNPIVVGVGNIYASEALFLAKIHPELPSKNLSKKQAEKLVLAIKEILTAAIKAGGTTIVDFQTPDGTEGYFFRELQVYGREKDACNICQTTIQKIKQTGRSTFFCPKCQKLKKAKA